jgi:hypothetical protein
LYCAICNKELKHKYKPAKEWNIDGFLCNYCHLEKTKEFILKRQEEQKKLEKIPDECLLCKKEVVFETDRNKPRWQWNMEPGRVLCKDCYEKKELDYDKKLNFCALCNKKMKFIRYNPKPRWKIEGQLCRECWDKRNHNNMMI